MSQLDHRNCEAVHTKKVKEFIFTQNRSEG